MTSTSSYGSSTSQPTVGALLRDASGRLRDSGSETGRLDAELLLGHVLRADRATLLAAPEAGVGPALVQAFWELIDRRATGEPVAYIRGLKEFYGIALSVDGRALIPRPETEVLVDLAMDRIRRLLTERPRPPGTPPLLIRDVGTGSGAISIALAVECRRRGFGREVRIVATDASRDAVALATENAVAHGLADVVVLSEGDLLADASAEPVDLVLANLPYIPTEIVPELPVAASFEPVAALDGGPDGLSVIRRLLKQLPEGLSPAGICMLEIGADQADSIRAAVREALPGWLLTIHPDLADQPRVAEVRREAGRSAR